MSEDSDAAALAHSAHAGTVVLCHDGRSQPNAAIFQALGRSIAALKAEQGAGVTITGVAEGDIPGTLIANAVITQPGQEDINVQAQFINQNGQWQLQKSFACALITNAGLQPPATCAGV